MDMFKIKSIWDRFCAAHPKLVPFFRTVRAQAIGEGTIIDIKVTDMFYECNRQAASGKDITESFAKIRERYHGIAQELSLTVDLDTYLDEVCKNIQLGAGADYAASRGEYLNGILLANYMGWDFVDPQTGIFFDKEGRLDSVKTQETLGAILKEHTHAVVPGFYGCDAYGNVKTFSRGGSDITGDIAAAAGEGLHITISVAAIEARNDGMRMLLENRAERLLRLHAVKTAFLIKEDARLRIDKVPAHVIGKQDAVEVFAAAGRVIRSGPKLNVLADLIKIRIQIDSQRKLLRDAVITLADFCKRFGDILSGCSLTVALVKHIRHLDIDDRSLSDCLRPHRPKERDKLRMGRAESIPDTLNFKHVHWIYCHTFLLRLLAVPKQADLLQRLHLHRVHFILNDLRHLIEAAVDCKYSTLAARNIQIRENVDLAYSVINRFPEMIFRESGSSVQGERQLCRLGNCPDPVEIDFRCERILTLGSADGNRKRVNSRHLYIALCLVRRRVVILLLLLGEINCLGHMSELSLHTRTVGMRHSHKFSNLLSIFLHRKLGTVIIHGRKAEFHGFNAFFKCSSPVKMDSHIYPGFFCHCD
jgi:hypothetical protein